MELAHDISKELTTIHKDGYGVLNEYVDPSCAITKLAVYEQLGTVEELRELAELDKAGRLVRVPANDVHTDPGLVYMLKNLDALLGAINGYELFLTRKAAQAAMEGTT